MATALSKTKRPLARPFEFLSLGILAYIGNRRALAQVEVASKSPGDNSQLLSFNQVRVYVCVYVYVYVYVCVCVCLCACACVHACVCARARACVHVFSLLCLVIPPALVVHTHSVP